MQQAAFSLSWMGGWTGTRLPTLALHPVDVGSIQEGRSSIPTGRVDAELLERFSTRLARCRGICTGRPVPGVGRTA
jgi:hypothetical protein